MEHPWLKENIDNTQNKDLITVASKFKEYAYLDKK
jgi:hypothetical protein